MQAVYATMDAIEREGVLKPPVAESLRSTLSYCRSATFGGCGAHLLRFLGDAAKGPPQQVSSATLEMFWFCRTFLATAKPRTLEAGDRRPHAVLFADGAEDREVVSCGAALFFSEHLIRGSRLVQ